MVKETLRLLSLTWALPGHESKGSLWQQLHSTIQQHMEPAAVGFDDLHIRAEKVLRNLQGLPDKLAGQTEVELRQALDLYRQGITISGLKALIEILAKGLEKLPEVSASRTTVSRVIPLHTNRFRIAVVEDNKQWQDFVLRAVSAVRDQLGPSFSISADCYSNVQDALKALIPKAKENPFAQTEQAERPEQVIAVTDMGLPADPEDYAAIMRGETTPDRANGHRLLAEIRSYRTNIPVVVLTTPPHLLSDQLDACRQGIEDYDYVLKGPDKEERLVEALLRQITRAQAHRIELWLNTEYELRVDGIPIPLGEMPFRTFYALCQLSSGSRNVAFRLESILDQLDETFRGEYDYKRPPETTLEHALVLGRQRSGHWWDPKWEIQIANVIRLWAARKADVGGDLSRAMELFKRENFQTWKDGLRLFDLYRRGKEQQPVEDLGPEVLQSGFERVFGGLEVDKREDYDLHNIEDHINQIRNVVHKVFNEVHRYIEPRRELIVGRPTNDEYGYRVLGEIIFHSDLESLEEDEFDVDDSDVNSLPSLRSERPVSVLVVENEGNYHERIRLLLEGAGFEVYVATNEEDAVNVARSVLPDIICLDLHIPATREEYEADPHSGDAEGGFRALEKIRQDMPQLHVVITTTLFNRDDLRETGARLNVSVTNIVPKGESTNGADWEGHLLLTHSRLRQEIRTRSVLPAPPPWLYPVIRVQPGTDWKQGRLNLVVNGKPFRMQKSKQGLLLSILLKKHDEVVPYRDIDSFVEGRGVSDNTRKMWVKNLREKIRAEWLSLSTDAPERPELSVLETVEGGLVLHAFVEGLGNSER
ncbi:MAG: hypothetical protein M3362_01800 [Acidobacteriota bacterium]|nr:hypothetical protein [Acidobacteriota bacterium]